MFGVCSIVEPGCAVQFALVTDLVMWRPFTVTKARAVSLEVRRSAGAGRPGRAIEANAEDCQTRQVDRGGSSVDVGGDAGEAATSSLAAAPQPASEVSEFAFDDRPIGSVALSKFRCRLFGTGGLQDRFVTVDAD